MNYTKEFTVITEEELQKLIDIGCLPTFVDDDGTSHYIVTEEWMEVHDY